MIFTIYITSLKHVSSAHRREKVKELPSLSEAVGACSGSAKMGANMSNLDVPTNMSRLPNGDHLCYFPKVLILKKAETTSKHIKLYLETTSPHL